MLFSEVKSAVKIPHGALAEELKIVWFGGGERRKEVVPAGSAVFGQANAEVE